jgi:hypothetical protein
VNADLMKQFDAARAAMTAALTMPNENDEQVCARLLVVAEAHDAMAEFFAAVQTDPETDAVLWRAAFDAESYNRAQAQQFRESVTTAEGRRR